MMGLWNKHAPDRILLLSLLLWAAANTAAKRAEGTLSLNSMVTEQYITKFSFSKGAEGMIKGNFSHLAGSGSYFDRHPHDLRILLLDDEAWPKYYDGSFTKHGMGSLCIERMSMATWQQRIRPHDMGTPKHAATSFEMKIPKGERKRTHFWYLVLADCYLEEYDAHPPAVHFDITFLNGGSHLPADETGLPTAYSVILLGTGAFIGLVGMVLRRQYLHVGQVHLITLLLGVAILLQGASHASELMHLWVYMRNGKGLRWRHTVFALDFVAQVTNGLAELLVEFLLITLAFGWTLIHRSGDGGGGSSSSSGGASSVNKPILGKLGLALSSGSDWLVRLIFFSSIAAAQVLLYCLERRYEGEFNQFHDFEHWPGVCLMGIRCALLGLFLAGGITTAKSAPGAAVKKFMALLLPLGSLWFLAMPLLVLIVTPLVEPYNRHPLVTGGTILLQSAALACVSTLFLKNSAYLKLSTLGQMGTMFSSPRHATIMKKFKVAVD